MGHLVKSMSDVSIAVCYRDLKEAHDYLAVQGAKAIELAWQKAGSSQWGSEVKRLNVSLPESSRPVLIGVDVKRSEHNLTEVMNQCATMERLLDTLIWVQTNESGLARFRVACCHPTTSSGDNDLVLVDLNGQDARFEIFDVVRDKPNNNKEKNSLISLGVWRKEDDQVLRTDWHDGRRFLTVSQEVVPFLLRAKRPWLRYIEIPITERTCVLEIKSA
jgi:hypothetical protein